MKGVAQCSTHVRPTKSAGQRARHAERTGSMRLMFSVIGFSAAYFLDPEHGAARRHQALEYLRRGKQMIASARAVTMRSRPAPSPTSAFGAPGPKGLTARPVRDGLRIAR